MAGDGCEAPRPSSVSLCFSPSPAWPLFFSHWRGLLREEGKLEVCVSPFSPGAAPVLRSMSALTKDHDHCQCQDGPHAESSVQEGCRWTERGSSPGWS